MTEHNTKLKTKRIFVCILHYIALRCHQHRCCPPHLTHNQTPLRILYKTLVIITVKQLSLRSKSCSTIWNYRNRIEINSGILKSKFRKYEVIPTVI